MMNWNGHMTTGGWIFSILGMVIILALAIAMIVLVARGLSGRRNRGPTSMSATAILERRLASGAINTEQYEQLRHSLGARPDSGPKSPTGRPADAAP